ncbi:MAG: histidine kinase [Bacteroidales bacterium]|nr:histidine kinase [Bacteroidales bacterium]
MKRRIILLFLFILAVYYCRAQSSKLPEKPWRSIVNMEKYYPVPIWEGDVSVKLFGQFSYQDSLQVAQSVDFLDSLTETINIQMSSHERGNLEIFFLDSINENVFKHILSIPDDEFIGWHYNFKHDYNQKRVTTIFNLGVRLSLVPGGQHQDFLTNALATALYPSRWDNSDFFDAGDEGHFTGPVSIFMREVPDGMQPYFSEMNAFDRDIIEAVYSSDYSQLLPQAKKQYGDYDFPKWLSPHLVLIFPFVLVLFLMAGLIILLYKRWFVRIKNEFVQFNVTAFLGLLLLGIMISSFLALRYELDWYNFGLSTFDFVAGIFLTVIFGLLGANFIRLVEKAINRNTQSKYLKTLLLFLSTTLIPVLSVFGVMYLSSRASGNFGENQITIILTFLVAFTIIGIIRALISFFVIREKELKIESELKISRLRELKSKAELNALHSKINPHFLYNALNSIAGLSTINPDKTEHMALSLSKLFRYSINKEQSDWSTIAEELKMVNIYLDIEKVRFENRLEFRIDMPEGLKHVQVPRFLIQPLVENAVKHGISKRVEQGVIKVSVRKSDDWLDISVADNGPDFPEDLAPGFGLQSIYDKLEIMYPGRFELHFLKSPDKQILIKLS